MNGWIIFLIIIIFILAIIIIYLLLFRFNNIVYIYSVEAGLYVSMDSSGGINFTETRDSSESQWRITTGSGGSIFNIAHQSNLGYSTSPPTEGEIVNGIPTNNKFMAFDIKTSRFGYSTISPTGSSDLFVIYQDGELILDSTTQNFIIFA